MKINELDRKGALVVFSGGQDSATCLAWALDRFSHVETVGYHYGQTHVIEMSVRQTVREKIAAVRPDRSRRLGDDHVFDASVIAAISRSRLPGASSSFLRSESLPDTFVP